MNLQVLGTTIPVLLLTIPGVCQTAPPHDDTVPIYHVTVVDRTVSAVNYQYRGGPTQIDFQGTVLLPKAKGDAIVESKAGRTEIDAKFEHLEAPGRFGPEYLTYVLWAITPEGHVKNLGEVVAGPSDKSHLQVTTDLQAFGLIVTAEPYSSVRIPSDVVVAENRVRPDTIGSTQPIHARFELLPRGTYTYDVSADLRSLNNGPKVSMDKYEQIVEIYQAQNAVQIAQSQGANQYAPEVIAKAQQELADARQLETRKAGRSMVVTAARAAAQTAEDARQLSVTRKQNAEIADAKDRVTHEQKLREEAEARAQQAQAVADQANAQANAEREALESERAQRAALTAPAAPPPPEPEAPPPVIRRTPPPDANQQQTATRLALLEQLQRAVGTAAELIDAPRGLVVLLHDADFRGDIPNDSVTSTMARIAPMVARTPGLVVEVDGYSDVAGGEAETLASERAEEVREALIHDGLKSNMVTARGMGTSHPLASNANVAGRGQNRRVEIVIAGSAIGNVPVWDKSYTLSLEH
ncbi:MAG TPA: OmpA family protein [Bryobacteraceae bacterium]|nr:OmpA family protein [Bryobacteraceae bacterium]